MDYGAMPPEFNSTRMYTGPGSGPMLEAAAGWDALAGELRSAASAYGSSIASLTSGPWIGPSSTAMAAAATPYVAWMNLTAEQAEMSGAQAAAAASAFEQAFAMTVPPPMVVENRVQLMILTATNILGQNTAAIAANEADYAEMWAQDAAAMYGYAASAVSAASGVTPFVPAPETTSAAGLASQAASGLQAAGSSMGGAQSALSQFVTSVPSALNGLAQPGSASASASPAADASSPFGGIFGDLSSSGLGDSLVAQYAGMPGLFGLFTATNALAPLMNPGLWLQFSQVAAQQAATEGAAAAQAAAAAAGAGAAPFAGGFGGGLAALGQGASIGGLSVPGGWGWAASAPTSMLGGMPMMAPLATVDPAMAAGLGMPMMMGGGGAGQGAGTAVGGTAKGKYGMPLTSVMTRPPSAGYGPAPTGPGAAAYPVPPGFPTGHAPPGYQPAIVYVPTAASN